MSFPDDPKLTAYALNELQGQERAAIEVALRDDPEARAAVEQIRAMATELTAALAHEASKDDAAMRSVELDVPKNGHAVRAAIIAGPDRAKLDGGPLEEYSGRPKVLQFPQLYFVIGGIAAAAVAVAVFVTDIKPHPHYQIVQLGSSGTKPSSTQAAGETENGGETSSKPRQYPVASTSDRLDIASHSPSAAETWGVHRDNPFVSAANVRWSTFGLDVDTTSYAEVRRAIMAGHLPPASTVRLEELLNYFPVSITAPTAHTDALATSLEVAESPWEPAHRLVRIGLKGKEDIAANRPRANLVFLIDVSGSMDADNKMPLIQQAMRLLIERLRPDDRIAIVTYAGTSGVVLPSTPVANATEILAALESLTATGSTDGAMGLDLSYDLAKANLIRGGINRVVLCTDGDFNVAPAAQGALAHLLDEKANSGVTLTALGFGMGQERDSTLELLAEKGRGTYGYVNSRTEAEKLLAEQAGDAIVAVARDVKVQVEFNPEQVESYRLLGYEDRPVQPQVFADDASKGSDVVAGQGVTAVYEVVPKVSREAVSSVAATDALLTLRVRYKEPGEATSRQIDFALRDEGKTFANASDDFKLAAAVAEFGMILRDSPHRGKASMHDVIAWASAGSKKRSGAGAAYRREFLDLAHRTATLLQ